jgi:membrane-associated HD superfamily phosphohydrolase
LADLKYYFNFDALQYTRQLNNFRETFNKEWIAYSLSEFNISSEEEYQNAVRFASDRNLQARMVEYIHSLLEKVYLRGIIELPEGIESLGPSSQIVLLRGNIAENIDLSELLTSRSAYEYVRAKLKEELSSNKFRDISSYQRFFEKFEMERFITPNVFYDSVASERERATRLDEVSMKKGMIQQGELIVSKGEIITSEIYQILQSLKAAYNDAKTTVNVSLVFLGKLIFILFTLFLIFIFLYNFRREVLRDIVKTAFILFLIVFMVFVARAYENLEKKWFYIIPFTILPIILRTFFDERVAVFIHVFTTLIIGIIAPNGYEFIVLNIFAGIVAIFSLTNLYRRSRFFLSALMVVLTYCLIYLGLHLIREGSFENLNLDYFTSFGINGVLILISFLLIYVFEKTFGFLSDTTLMELSDTNQPLLRSLAEVAPGTFQHSLQVATLSEEAIHQIGGNPLLVRTGALYHDIGKMSDPIYFI